MQIISSHSNAKNQYFLVYCTSGSVLFNLFYPHYTKIELPVLHPAPEVTLCSAMFQSCTLVLIRHRCCLLTLSSYWPTYSCYGNCFFPLFSFEVHVGVHTQRITFAEVMYWLWIYYSVFYCLVFWALVFTFNIFIVLAIFLGLLEIDKEFHHGNSRGQKRKESILFPQDLCSLFPFCFFVFSFPCYKKSWQCVKLRWSVCTFRVQT